MKGTRLNEILSSLTKEEFLRLNEYLHSQYLNKNKQIILFYYFLSAKETHPDYLNVKRQEIFEYIYKGQDFNLDKYLKVSSDFVKAIESFLIFELRAGRELQTKKDLLEIAGNRDLPKTFSKYSGEIRSKTKTEINKNLEFYLTEYDYKIESILYSFNNKKFDLEKAILDLNSSVNTIIIHLKLELLLKMFHISDKENNIWLDKEVIKFIEENETELIKFHPMIYLRSRILKMLTDSDETIYKQVKSFVEKNRKRLNQGNLVYLYDELMSFCNLIGNDYFKKEEFNLIKSLEENSLLEKNNLDCIYFLKIIDTALNENDAYWAESFLNKYSEEIGLEYRESTVNLAMASINIYRQKFNEALNNISLVSANNDFFYLSSKTMSLIIFYELDDTSAIKYAVDSFETYLYRKKAKAEFDYNIYKSFVDLFKKLIKLKQKNISSAADDIFKKLKNDKSIINRTWFLRKLRSV
jgi:hypothetical protein